MLPTSTRPEDFTAHYPIVHVDDDSGVRTLISLILRRNGLKIISTTHTDEALRIITAQPVSLVISDINRPDKSGFDLLDILRSDPVTYYLPFLFLSASGMADTIKEACDRGADYFLTKPVFHYDLIAVVRHLLEDRSVPYLTSLNLLANPNVILW